PWFFKMLESRGQILVSYNTPEILKVMNLIRKIKSEREMLQGDNDAYQLYQLVKATNKTYGDIAEVGCFNGATAKLIRKANKNKELHLFDTFEGLPKLHCKDDPKQFCEGLYSSSLKDVKNYLKKYKKIHFYKGIFPNTSIPIIDKTFSFVHLDVDLYESTLESIKFFYPRMNKGGIILSHDYPAIGVRKAFEEFFKCYPEPVIDLSGSQCLIVKN
ncbi:hypothetical protein LCGC14_2372020, partial [marine sediment metagenome]